MSIRLSAALLLPGVGHHRLIFRFLTGMKEHSRVSTGATKAMANQARLILIIGGIFAAVVSTAIAQQPPDVVVSDANGNTAMGSSALESNSTGEINTAAGDSALISNTTGNNNTAFGYLSLADNSSGNANTAVGVEALTDNGTGNNNTALGLEALWANTTGDNNTAAGYQALLYNSTGGNSTALGYQALLNNSTGNNNTAAGYQALYNTNASGNTAVGYSALYNDTTGGSNTAVGTGTLGAISTGVSNVAVGYQAGAKLTTERNNVSIANPGVAGESGSIRIGSAGSQTATFIAGVVDSRVTGSAVFITSTGRLGVLASSERYKTDIAPLAADEDRLLKLRPVSFHLKTEPDGTLQYGLIAEEVERVYPELVIRDERGNTQGVRYEELTPMLLSEVQQQAAEIRELKQQRAVMQIQLEELDGLKQELRTAIGEIRSKGQIVAQR